VKGRKGQEQITLTRAMLLALGLGAVFLAILNAVMTINSNEEYIKQLAITTIGLDLQSLQSFGQDINAERDITDAGPYHLALESGRVYYERRGQPSSLFLFTQTPEYTMRNFPTSDFLPEKGATTIGPLKLYKSGKFYGAAKPDKVPSHYLLVCDTPKGPSLKAIALDPGHGYDGKAGYEGDKIAALGMAESKYTLRLANSFRTATSGRIAVNPTRALDKDSPATTDTRKNTAGDAFISLHAGSRTDNLEAAKAYYNAKNPYSRRLACEILNGIANQYNIPVRPIPVNADSYPPDDPKKVLGQKRPAVLVEIGNSNKMADNILGETGNIANSIFKGVETYNVG